MQGYFKWGCVVMFGCMAASVAWAVEDVRQHIVKQGETLSGIAKMYYGDPHRWKCIVEANTLLAPDRLKEGQKLVIPPSKAPATADASPETKAFAAPLHLAVRNRDIVTVKALLASPVASNELNAVFAGGITPLHLAVATDQTDIADLLITHGADVSAASSSGFTPLHWAASRDNVDIIRLLLNAGGNVNARAQRDITPLHLAVQKNAVRAVRALLEAGADVAAAGRSELTPLQLAEKQTPHSEIAGLLAQAAGRQKDPLRAPATPVPESDTIRRLAEAALVQHYPGIDLSSYNQGYIVRLESPVPAVGTRVVVSWLGREALELKKGATLEQDRKQVLKIEVWMNEEGQVLKVGDRPVWINRNMQIVSDP
jgi:hypothetical protein